jgi:hypothetical protein
MSFHNLGNTCWMATGLHLIFAILDSISCFGALELDIAKRVVFSMDAAGRPFALAPDHAIAQELMSLYQQVRTDPTAVIVPVLFYNLFCERVPIFGGLIQQPLDSFLYHLFDLLPNLALATGTRVIRTITCTCGLQTATENTEYQFLLPMMEYSNLHAMLEARCARTQVDRDCPQCFQPGINSKIDRVYPGDTIFVCPNPFDENRNKVNRQVTFPPVLDLSGYLAFEQQGGQYIYELRAIGVHTGATLNSGHFHFNDRTDGNWNNISDTIFTRIADHEARAPIGATHAVYRVRG